MDFNELIEALDNPIDIFNESTLQKYNENVTEQLEQKLNKSFEETFSDEDIQARILGDIVAFYPTKSTERISKTPLKVIPLKDNLEISSNETLSSLARTKESYIKHVNMAENIIESLEKNVRASEISTVIRRQLIVLVSSMAAVPSSAEKAKAFVELCFATAESGIIDITNKYYTKNQTTNETQNNSVNTLKKEGTQQSVADEYQKTENQEHDVEIYNLEAVRRDIKLFLAKNVFVEFQSMCEALCKMCCIFSLNPDVPDVFNCGKPKTGENLVLKLKSLDTLYNSTRNVYNQTTSSFFMQNTKFNPIKIMQNARDQTLAKQAREKTLWKARNEKKNEFALTQEDKDFCDIVSQAVEDYFGKCSNYIM